MKRNICKLLAILLTLLLVAGCGRSEGPSSTEAPSPEVSAPEENPVSPDEAELLDQLAGLFETVFDGCDYSEEESPYSGGSFARGFLYQNNLLSRYQNQSAGSLEIPFKDLEAVDRLFFPNLQGFSESQLEMTYSCDAGELEAEYDPVLTLVREEIQRMEDGTISVTYQRKKLDHILIPVTYRFRPFQLEEVPQGLAGLYQSGDTFYQFVSVTQRPDRLPEPPTQFIEIATAQELLAAAQRINEGGYATAHDTYRLTADIDLAGVEWTPMGMNTRVFDLKYQTWRDPSPLGFEGTFDGQGHTIYNLTITEEQGAALVARGEQDYPDRKLGGAALFYRIGTKGVVKNLRLENASVSLPLSAEKDTTGSAALLAVDCMGRAENVSVQGRVQGIYFVGGLAGSLLALDDDPGRLENCSADVEVTGWSTVGGLVGFVQGGTLEGCTAQGSVTVAEVEGVAEEPLPQGVAGGLMGSCFRAQAVGCGASAAISAPDVLKLLVGGFCGNWDSSNTAEGCWVDGEKSAPWEPVGYSYQTAPEIEIR